MSYMTIGSNGNTRILPCHYEEPSPFVIARLAKPDEAISGPMRLRRTPTCHCEERSDEAISGAMRLPRTLRVLATTG
jgi:hypothetical protein